MRMRKLMELIDELDYKAANYEVSGEVEKAKGISEARKIIVDAQNQCKQSREAKRMRREAKKRGIIL